MPETTQRNMTRPMPPPSNGAMRKVKTFTRSSGVTRKAWRIGVVGCEGSGKSSLAALYPGVVFIDLEGSTKDLNVERIEGVTDWNDLRQCVQNTNATETPVLAIDSMTRAEDWCVAHVIKTKQSNDGMKATDSIEDFKYKAGLKFVCDEFRRFLADLDAAHERGITVIMIAHNRVARFRNPDGSDFFRNEPRLLNEDKDGNMLPWIQFLDHLLFIDYDVSVEKGKATGNGSRAIYTASSATRMAKSRTLDGLPVPFAKGSDAIWQAINAPAAVATDDLPPM